jgi:SAM-dependent methyltransferase
LTKPADAAPSPDLRTAQAFAESWNHVGSGSVYTWEQFLDWFAPLAPADLEGRSVLELGFGNGSLLVHAAACRPARLDGVDLGDTMEQARRNLAHLPEGAVTLHQGDLTRVDLGPFDLVYCIGVLHHLRAPEEGFRAVLRHTRPGGRFHAWVYAREGNGVVIALVDPLRRMASRLPWWLTKYALATPLALPYFLYAKALRALVRAAPRASGPLSALPLFRYSLWIAERPYWFFRHVAFDQLVTPRTVYIKRETVDEWLRDADVEPDSTYVVFRNGNSWKFGGRRRC